MAGGRGEARLQLESSAVDVVESGRKRQQRVAALGARFDRPVSGTDQHAGKERGLEGASVDIPAANHSGAAFVAPPPNCRRRCWAVCQLSLPARCEKGAPPSWPRFPVPDRPPARQPS